MAMFKINDDVKLVKFPGMPEASITVVIPDTKESKDPEYIVTMICNNEPMEFYVKESELISAKDISADIMVLPPQILQGRDNSDVFKRARLLTCTNTNPTPVPVMEIAVTWSGNIVTTVLNDLLSRTVSPTMVAECTGFLLKTYMALDNYNDGKLSFNANKKMKALEKTAKELFRMQGMNKASMMAAEYLKEELGEDRTCTREDAECICNRAYTLGIMDKNDKESMDKIWKQAVRDSINTAAYMEEK